MKRWIVLIVVAMSSLLLPAHAQTTNYLIPAACLFVRITATRYSFQCLGGEDFEIDASPHK